MTQQHGIDPNWSPEVAAAVAEALAEAPVFDGHNDLPAVLRARAGYSVADLDVEAAWRHTDLPRLRRGGVGAQFWSAWVPPSLPAGDAVQATLEQIDAIHRLAAAYPKDFAFARTAADVRAAWSSGRIASLIGIEGGHSIGRSLAVLRTFAQLGARYLTLTHTSSIEWADSGTDEEHVDGLNDEGRAVVAELNLLGVLVDLSHTAESTQLAALAATRAPVIFSHSSAKAVADHPRNVSDAVLQLLAAGGGVALVTFVPDFISPALAEWSLGFREHLKEIADGAGGGFGGFWKSAPLPGETPADTLARQAGAAGADSAPADFAALTRKWEEKHPRPAVGIEDAVRHVEHIREVAGIDHVGLGGDYDGVPFQPEGLEDVAGYPRLLAALAERGWSATDLSALTGRNVLRVLQDAEDAAR
ncbi:MAG: dipeptidase [Bifidobacteriaceae bacterium]|jgi:membrane dipeptidase|nr:dipeptidase [Bifidobacteriaceae bacterium]